MIVVGSVISGKDGHLSGSVAADALDGHLSHAESSHGQRHGIYRALGTILFNSELGENRGNLSFRFGMVLQVSSGAVMVLIGNSAGLTKIGREWE